MDPKFKTVVEGLPYLLEQLLNSTLKFRLENFPTKGIYVFYENDRPIYVGRSNRMKTRIQEHSRPSSGHFSATFAFNLAIKRAKEIGIDINKARGDLLADAQFKPLFLKEKERVSKMSVRVIEIDDQVTQALFEVYAALSLDTTEYNDFSTH